MSFYFDPRFYSLGLSVNVATLAAYIFYRSNGTGRYDDSDDFAARVLMGHVENGRRSIIRWKKEIEEIGLIKSTKKSNKHGATIYAVCTDKLSELIAPACDNMSQLHQHTCDNVSQGDVTNSHTHMGQIVTQKEVLKEFVKKEEENARAREPQNRTPPQSKHKRAKGQKHYPDPTPEQIEKLRVKIRPMQLLQNDVGMSLTEEITYALKREGFDGMMELAELAPYDDIIRKRDKRCTLSFIVHTAERIRLTCRPRLEQARANERARSEKAAKQNVVREKVVMTQEERESLEQKKAYYLEELEKQKKLAIEEEKRRRRMI